MQRVRAALGAVERARAGAGMRFVLYAVLAVLMIYTLLAVMALVLL